MSATTTTESARIMAKSSRTDPAYQSWLVRRPVGSADPAEWEYYHPQLCRWCSLPSEWAEMAQCASWSAD